MPFSTDQKSRPKSPTSSELEGFFQSQVRPKANQLDQDSTALFEMFGRLGERGWLTPKRSEAQGGLGFDPSEYRQFQSLMARYSGALAFLLTQHQSAASLIAGSDNEVLKQRYLAGMTTGKQRIGVGFSHLRRRSVPLLAKPTAQGYRLTGVVPWVTGAGLFTHFVGGAALADDGTASSTPNGTANGSAVFGLLPLASQTTEISQIVTKAPMALGAMVATRTVEVVLQDWLLPKQDVLAIKPPGWIHERDRANPLSPLGLIFGCAQAGLDVLNEALRRRQINHGIAQQLAKKLARLQTNLPEVMALPKEAFSQKVALRGQAISLMNTCAQAAIIASSGAANLMSHPAQRIYKESLVFSVSGQTTQGVIASLNSLLTPSTADGQTR